MASGQPKQPGKNLTPQQIQRLQGTTGFSADNIKTYEQGMKLYRFDWCFCCLAKKEIYVIFYIL